MSQQPALWDPLSDEDKYYLRENLELECEGGPFDPQAQRVYAAEANMIDGLAPIWSMGEVEAQVRAFAERHGLRMKLRWRMDRGGSCFVGRGGGTIVLNDVRNAGCFTTVKKGEHLSSVVIHDLAHVLTPNRWRRPERYGSLGFQSHGPEFVRCYLDLLRDHIDARKAAAAFEFLGVDIAPEGELFWIEGFAP